MNNLEPFIRRKKKRILLTNKMKKRVLKHHQSTNDDALSVLALSVFISLRITYILKNKSNYSQTVKMSNLFYAYKHIVKEDGNRSMFS